MTARKKLWLNILGYFFLVLGVIGCVLPFLQGILFILVGLSILSQTSPWAARLLNRFRTKYPKIAEKTDAFLLKLFPKKKGTSKN
ncbi:PGPGW domain-containing protein [Baia soyae]|uniref:Putative transmembrane protein PGPGW n=1 Tax=Baia soyae TaxID=1544746 RepID=A0A4R2RZH3_9BACL|nr:PGPGW domain-containing protein [Baia soyae]TCP65421.1 putative transmembrane protein PGPGW [Baia soyae]